MKPLNLPASVNIPLGLVAMSFRCEAQETVLFVVLLPWLCLPSLLFVCTRRGLLRIVIAGYSILEVGNEAVERVVDLLEERHAAAALVGR
jgi:diacylglycerol kinase